MSNGFKENGVIAEERVTLEPYPEKNILILIIKSFIEGLYSGN